MKEKLPQILLVIAFLLPLKFFSQPLQLSQKELLGKIDPQFHPDFEEIPAAYTNKQAWLRTEVVDALIAMCDAAYQDGISLKVISATRNFDYQMEIWERKWNSYSGTDREKALKILQYSSMPGTSRHHWGTDFDLNSLEPSFFESGQGLRIYNWLRKNAHHFGFYQPYTRQGQDRPEGYREEKWHWSYLPTASLYLQAFNHLSKNIEISGFEGSEFAEELDVFSAYVNGISPELKKHQIPKHPEVAEFIPKHP